MNRESKIQITRFETDAHLRGWSEVSTSFIRWITLNNISTETQRDTYWHTQTGDERGRVWCLFQIPYIKIHLLIDLSIRLIESGVQKRTEGHISTTEYIRKYYINDLQQRGGYPLLTYKNQGGDGDGPCLFPIKRHQYSPYWSIDGSFDLSTDRQNGRPKRTEVHISSAVDIKTHYLTDL